MMPSAMRGALQRPLSNLSDHNSFPFVVPSAYKYPFSFPTYTASSTMAGEENNFPEAVNSQSFSPLTISSAAKRPATDGTNNVPPASMGAPCTDGANLYSHWTDAGG